MFGGCAHYVTARMRKLSNILGNWYCALKNYVRKLHTKTTQSGLQL